METASAMARQAPCAGYMAKMGANVPGFKRRFFVLQPTTSLYYFVSEQDTTPRGCLDIDDSTRLQEVGELSDGRYRFAICWEDDRKVVLEARTKELGHAWMQSLEKERMSYVKNEMKKGVCKNSAYTSRIAELEQQVADYKHVEKDRDGALEDAARWKEQFEQLDESLRRLTQQLRRQPSHEPEPPSQEKQPQVDETVQDEKKEPDDASLQLDENSANESDGKATANESSHTNASRETSLLDEGMNAENSIDVMNVPGVHYSALFNTCEQLRESLRLTSAEATTAVEDLNSANDRVINVEKRMEKAEKHLGKLWEENCSVRKALKQKKREKRVLVREVRNLQGAAKTDPADAISVHDMPDDSSSMIEGSDDEDKLINELEEHVISSIRLHEQLISASGLSSPRTKASSTELNNSADSSITKTGPTVKIGAVVQTELEHYETPTGGVPLASLFDDSESDDDDVDDAGSTTPSFVSSVVAEASDCETNGVVDAGIILKANARPDTSQDSTPERRNPLLQLDEDDESDVQPNLCATSSQSESSKSVFANREHATSRLACPLADVVQTRQSGAGLPSGNEELQVYHLTFYSRKIGIQFQKVPPPPVKARGLLTDAMTADLAEEPSGSEKTAAELRRIAQISTWAKTEDDNRETTCQVATPVDAVLVCGFHGFDDSGSNARPNLGSRLVAFDGVSVEVGKWTFDSIRKSIQARARPLTLSFRNDFLTTEQRTILTKAVKEVDAAVPPPRRTIQYRMDGRRPSIDPSVQSHESGQFINDHDDDYRRTPHSNAADDDLSASAGSSSEYYRDLILPQSFSGARSVSSYSNANRSTGNFRSFSEAGSSVSVLSAVGPLMANLLHGRSSEPFTPEYLRRAPESVEGTPQHQDFKSELL